MRKVLLILSIMVASSLCSTSAFAAVANDEVTSIKLKEADGTSGQNTNSGSGVKTGHIQDGAVTDAKISGQISTSKLNVGTTPGSVAAGDHNHDGVYKKSPPLPDWSGIAGMGYSESGANSESYPFSWAGVKLQITGGPSDVVLSGTSSPFPPQVGDEIEFLDTMEHTNEYGVFIGEHTLYSPEEYPIEGGTLVNMPPYWGWNGRNFWVYTIPLNGYLKIIFTGKKYLVLINKL
jgi:hypothetical protein